jgi:hypothetical protein
MKQNIFTGNELAYKTTVKGTLTYRADAWTLKREHKSK